MNDLESRLRAGLSSIADSMEPDIDPLAAVAAGDRLRCARTTGWLTAGLVLATLFGLLAWTAIPGRPITGIPAPAAPTTAEAPITAPPTPAPTPSATPTPTPAMGARLRLRGDGIGPFTFGAKKVDVAAVLNDRLGDPKQGEQGILCTRVGSPWAEIVIYGAQVSTPAGSGPFLVYYTAKDPSKESPRYLAAWNFNLEEKLPAALAMQDDVPLNLTFNQLKAKYPAGKPDPHIGYGAYGFILPNKLRFVANPATAASKPALVQAGQWGCD